MTRRYCKTCRTGTLHRKLPQSSFATQCGVALLALFVTGSGIDLREPEWECLECGREVMI